MQITVAKHKMCIWYTHCDQQQYGLDTHLIDYSGIYHHCEAYYIMQKLQKNDFCSFSKYAWLFQSYSSCQKLCFRAQGKSINHRGAKTGISRVRLHSSVSLSNS